MHYMETIYLVVIIAFVAAGLFYGIRDLLRKPIIEDFGTYKTANDEFDIDKMWEAINSLKFPDPVVTIIPASLLLTEHGPMLREYAASVPDVHFSKYATEIVQFPTPKFNLSNRERIYQHEQSYMRSVLYHD